MNPNVDKMPTPETSMPGFTPGSVESGPEIPAVTPEVSTVESKASFVRTPVITNPIISSVNPASTTMQSVSPVAQPVLGKSNATPATKGAQDIEKEYVTKAKAIIAQTKADPYMQSKELSKVKAEYIKKQFGKDIKISER